jgi:peptide/nickel transport system substrate-binding protein
VQSIPADLGKQIDDLIAQGIASTDRSGREKIYKQLQNIAYENALDLFLEQPKNRFYEQAWVKGWYYNPTYPSGTGVGVYFYVLSKGQ